jgi:hypothetical protein
MKMLVFIVTLLGISFSSPADSFRLEGEVFHPATNLDVIWKATNDLPRGLWIYKVMSEAISAAVISNAMRLGHFTLKNYSKNTESAFQDKHLIYFFAWNNETNHQRRFLYIAPTLGTMQYSSDKDHEAPIESVPTAEEAEKMAEDVLFQLGIDRSLVCNPQTGYDETSIRYKYNRQTHELIPPGTTNVTLRGVAFHRQIDGILESSVWCFLIHFRSHGEIEDFSLTWKNLLPQESRRALKPDEIVQMIKSGQAVLPPQFSDTSDLDGAKRFDVIKATPYYQTGNGKEALDFVYPYIEMEISADFGTNNSRLFYLQCPILSTNTVM